MVEPQGTRDEQNAPSAAPENTPGEAAGQEGAGLAPLAQGESRTDEVDQSRGIFPAGVPHPADAPMVPPGALGGGPFEESGRGGVAVSVEQSSTGAGAAGADVSGASAAGALSLDGRSITTLNDLIHLDIDAIQAYRRAIDACEIAEIRDALTDFMGDHERHVRDLREAVSGLGGEPAEGRDVKGFFIEGFTAIVSQGDRSALLAMRGNEEITNRCYDAARGADLPVHIRPLIERNYQDEARHLAWIKEAISSRAWDAEPDAKKAA